MIKKLLLNRNMILVLAIIFGLFLNQGSAFLKNYNIYILATVMAFSTTGIALRGLLPVSRTIRIMSNSIFLGYFVFSSVLLILSWFIISDPMLFYGMVIIAASPPGVAVIPFTHILKGNMNYTMIGTLGAYLAGVIITPLMLLSFSGATLSPVHLLWVMVKIIIIPFLLSRILLLPVIFPVVEKIRGRVVDFGFALIIYVAVGLNRSVFFQNYGILTAIGIILFLSMFGLGWLHRVWLRIRKVENSVGISQNLLLTIKSSGFTASASLAVFGKEAAVPSAVLAVIVLVYLIYLSMVQAIRSRR